MTTAVRFAVLGAHEPDHPGARRAHRADPGERFFDAVDLAVDLADDGRVVLGLRTAAYVEAHGGRPESWDDGYVPLPITRDLSTVRHFDFKEVFWLGPESHACLVWSNAEGLGLRAIEHLLGDRPGSRLLAGPRGTGLPGPDDLDLDVPASLAWHRIGADVVGGSTGRDPGRR